MKISTIFQYLYLVFAGLFVFKGFSIWSTDRSRAYLMLFLAGVAIFMYFFRKHFNTKFQNRKNQQ